MTKLENALIWLYLKAWGRFGEHVIEEKGLWKFGADDLESAVMGLAYRRKRKPNENEKTERVEALTELIMEKFEQDRMVFDEWSATVHSEYIASLPTTSQQQSSPTVVKKIRRWSPGKYLRR